jgi:outer membrane lipoprotein-sorting protein
MRHILSILLWSVLLPVALAQDNEAEKLFRDMEKKLHAAKAFQLAVTIETKGDTKDRVGSFKGSLLLTNDNKARLKISGDDFGEARNWEIISNGKQLRLKPYAAMPVFKDEATLPTPKNLHGMLTARVSGHGVFLNVLSLTYLLLEADDPRTSKLDIWGFKMGAGEKVAGRDAKVVSYKAGPKEEKDHAAFTVWIDSKTLLPLKRVIVPGRTSGSAGITISETYTKFTLDPKIDAKAFVLPKAAVLPEENIAIEKLPKAVTESAKKRFPKTELRGAVFARPGSEWLRPGEKRELYLLDLKNGNLHIALWITPNGAITEIVNEIKAVDLPKEVKQCLDKNYPGETVQEVNELFKVKEGKETLESIKVFLSTAANSTRVLLFSPEGKLLKEEK